MIKILSIIGARPQIIKAAAISRAIRSKYADEIKEIILHTGQHYDHNMSAVFFTEMEIPAADINLNVGSASHGKQTADMIVGIENAIQETQADFVLVYGDTNSTLAASIAASKLHAPIIHVEAGLRSFNKKMPEEINRILCDHSSTLLFSPTKTGYQNLIKEGFSADNAAPFNPDNPGIFHCGDIMLDNSLHFSKIADKNSKIVQDLHLENKEFVLCTIHRDSNTDNPEKLTSIFKAIHDISTKNNIPFIIPLHPRTKKILKNNIKEEVYQELMKNSYVQIIEPLGFLDMIALEKGAKLIMTDSGGVQKEAYFFNKACVILRPETEWVEIVEEKAAIICDTDYNRIISAYKHFSENTISNFPEIFGNGKAAEFIVDTILNKIISSK
jgi:UDP-GlcNAc3NAcA epimerase